MNRYLWYPGNGSRYDLVYGQVDEQRSMVIWLSRGGSGGTALVFTRDHFLHHTYLEDKMRVGEVDGEMICKFLVEMGHDVGITRDTPTSRPPKLEVHSDNKHDWAC